MLDPVCLEPLHRRHLAVVNQYSVLHRKQHRLKVHLEEPDRHQHTLYLVAAHNPYNRLVVQRYLVQNRIKAQVRIEKTRNESIPLGCVPPAFVALGGRIPYGGCPTPDTLSPPSNPPSQPRRDMGSEKSYPPRRDLGTSDYSSPCE